VIFEIERRVVFKAMAVLFCGMTIFGTYHESLAQSQPPQQESRGTSRSSSASHESKNWHPTEGRVKIKLPTIEMTVAEPNKIPLDLHGFAVSRIGIEWKLPEPGLEGQYGPESIVASLQRDSDGSPYVNFVPVRLGKLKLRVLVAFEDGGIDDDGLDVNVDRLPDQPPARLILSDPRVQVDFNIRAGTLHLDLAPSSSWEFLIPVAFYPGVDAPIPLIPAPSQIQSQLSYSIIPRKNQAAPIVFDGNSGKVTAARPGQALFKVTLDNQSAYACVDVMQDGREFLQRSNCSGFLPHDLKEPIDKGLYINKPVTPATPAH
jgi:hypothetical protein